MIVEEGGIYKVAMGGDVILGKNGKITLSLMNEVSMLTSSPTVMSVKASFVYYIRTIERSPVQSGSPPWRRASPTWRCRSPSWYAMQLSVVWNVSYLLLHLLLPLDVHEVRQRGESPPRGGVQPQSPWKTTHLWIPHYGKDSWYETHTARSISRPCCTPFFQTTRSTLHAPTTT